MCLSNSDYIRNSCVDYFLRNYYYYIIFVQFHCWKYLGNRGPKILFSGAAMLASPVLGVHKVYKALSTSQSFVSK
jgi:hypothetical protein